MDERAPTWGPSAVGTPDIASLGNFVDVYDVVSKLRPFPFGRESIFAVAGLIAPLTLTVYSPQQLGRAF